MFLKVKIKYQNNLNIYPIKANVPQNIISFINGKSNATIS